jgi:hypothetical protein
MSLRASELVAAIFLCACALPEATLVPTGGAGGGTGGMAGAGGGGSGGVGAQGGGGAVGGYAELILADGPIGYWRLGEAAGAMDAINEIAGGVDGVYVGALELGQPGAIADDGNTAAKLVGGQVFFGDGFEFDGVEPFTFELWISFPALPSVEACVFGTAPGGHYEFTTPISPPTMRFARDDDAGTDFVESPIVSVGDYVHVAVTHDGGDLFLYVDGTQVDYAQAGPALPSAGLSLGECANWPNGTLTVDELAIYDRALSAAEVAEHHTAGVGGT